MKRRADACDDFCRAIEHGDRKAARAAIMPARWNCDLDACVLLWVAWAGPVNKEGLPVSCLEGPARKKLTALRNDKLVHAGPCSHRHDIEEELEELVSEGSLRKYGDLNAGVVAYELTSQRPARRAPRAGEFP